MKVFINPAPTGGNTGSASSSFCTSPTSPVTLGPCSCFGGKDAMLDALLEQVLAGLTKEVEGLYGIDLPPPNSR